MGFKRGKSPQDVVKHYEEFVRKTSGPVTREVMTEVVVAGAGFSKEIAPLEYGTLINSQFMMVRERDGRTQGVVGYAVNYALPLHGTDKYTPLWTPRPPEDKEGPAWNPNSGPQFLTLGFEGMKSKPIIQKLIIDGYRIK